MSQIPPAPPGDDDDRAGAPPARRAFLQKVGLVTAVAWTAPSILSVTAASAATVGPLPDPATFVAVGASPFVWRSTDGGASWAVATIAANAAIGGVATDGLGNWVATVGIGTAPFVKRSTDDGLTWTSPSVSPGAARGVVAVAVTSTGTTWVALRGGGTNVNATARSIDGGDTWSSFAGSPSGVSGFAVGPTVSSIDPDARTWVAVGGANAYRSTDDCATFVTIALPSGDVARMRAVATDGLGNWVAVNGNINGADLLRVWTSGDDGVTWALATTQPDGVCTGVATDGQGTWVAVGSHLNATNTAPDSWRSTDNGATWTGNSTNTVTYSAVATDALGHWVATDTLSTSRRGWTSIDAGSIWTPGTPSFGTGIVAVAAGRLLP